MLKEPGSDGQLSSLRYKKLYSQRSLDNMYLTQILTTYSILLMHYNVLFM